jgi:hypothetical protein
MITKILNFSFVILIYLSFLKRTDSIFRESMINFPISYGKIYNFAFIPMFGILFIQK